METDAKQMAMGSSEDTILQDEKETGNSSSIVDHGNECKEVVDENSSSDDLNQNMGNETAPDVENEVTSEEFSKVTDPHKERNEAEDSENNRARDIPEKCNTLEDSESTGHEVDAGDGSDGDDEVITSKKKKIALNFSDDEDEVLENKTDSDGMNEELHDEDESLDTKSGDDKIGEEIIGPCEKAKPKTLKSMKIMKEEKNKIFSEGQRMIRESPINIPQYKPKQLSLTDFLNRKKTKISHPKLKPLALPSCNSFVPSGPITDSASILDSSQTPPYSFKTEEGDEKENDYAPALRLRVSETAGDSQSLSQLLENEKTGECSSSVGEDAVATPSNLSLKAIKSSILESVKSFTPKLNCDTDSILSLDEPLDNADKEFDNFMDRFTKHSLKRKPKEQKEVNLSVVQKEVDEDGKVVLKQNQVSITTPAEEPEIDESLKTPGAKLLSLKKMLHAKISVKREQGRLKRVQLHELDNENFEGEEEEAEMTDSDDDDKDQEMDEDVRRELFDEEAQEEDEGSNEMKKEAAEKESNSSDEVQHDNDVQGEGSSDSDDDEEDIVFKNRKRKSVVIQEDDEDDCEVGDVNDTQIIDEEPVEENFVKEDKHDLVADVSMKKTTLDDQEDEDANASFEMQGTMFAPYQKASNLERQASDTSVHNSSFFGTPIADSNPLPIEDSQDLFAPEGVWTTNGQQKDHIFMTPFNQAETQMDDGKNSFSCKRSLLLEDTENTPDDDMSELLGLCSGKFPENVNGKLTAEVESSKNHDMNELIGLCSGKFSGKSSGSAESKTQNDMDELIGLCSGKFQSSLNDDLTEPASTLELGPSNAADIMSESEDELQSDNDNNESDADSVADASPSKIGKNFFENEAELSGSEAESDEDLDIAAEDDILDEELGDMDELPSDDELRDQVGRVHFKTMLDEDKKELRLYQEMYLEDGDLHGDGQTRMRSFKWKNIDDNSNDENLRNSDGEMDEKDEEEDEKWRLQRHEREKWFEEQKNEINEGEDHFLKFGKKAIVRQSSFKQKQNENKMLKDPNDESESLADHPCQDKGKRGSFLLRKRNSLNKIAQFTGKAANANLNSARQLSKNFVFSTVSPTSEEKSTKISKVTTKKAPNGTVLKKAKIVTAAMKTPQIKRSNSLFSYL